MEPSFWTALGASSLAALITATGVYTIRRHSDWGRRHSIHFVSFAAGVLIAVSFLHIVPKSLSMAAHAPAGLLAGFVLLHLFNRFITAFVCERPIDTRYGIGLIPVIGIGFHSFVDGFVYSITFAVSLFTGTLAAIGMVLHEFPEGIITYVLLLRSGFSERSAVALALIAAALSTPLGTLISWPWVSGVDVPLLGVLLALSAGALIYVGATHLLPQVEHEADCYSLLTLGAGILVGVFIVLAG